MAGAGFDEVFDELKRVLDTCGDPRRRAAAFADLRRSEATFGGSPRLAPSRADRGGVRGFLSNVAPDGGMVETKPAGFRGTRRPRSVIGS
jgi:hypothetical protein